MAEIESVKRGQVDLIGKWLSENARPSATTKVFYRISRPRRQLGAQDWLEITDDSARLIARHGTVFVQSAETEDVVATDEASSVKGEIDELRDRIGRLEAFVFSYVLPVAKTAKKAAQTTAINRAVGTSVDDMCRSFVDLVKGIDTVQQVFLSVTDDLATVLTVIDAPAFRDDLREPIYRAQLQILRMTEKGARLDFDLVNVQELSEKEDLAAVVPENARAIWSR